jgi:hypothetical protein
MKSFQAKVMVLVCCGLFAAASSSLSFAQTNADTETSGSQSNSSPDANPSATPFSRPTRVESTNSDRTPGEATTNQTQGNTQDQTPPTNNSQAPSLEDLGLTPSQTQSDPQLQARLDKRTHMLKIHQRLGLITMVPMIATVATSFGAGGRSTSTSDRWAHLALGAATGDLYFTTAYFAIFAPRIPGTQTRGQIRVHKALAWVHGPGMILTPILGAIAFDQKSKGEKVHGIASAHGPVAIVTAGAFAAALVSVSFKF